MKPGITNQVPHSIELEDKRGEIKFNDFLMKNGKNQIRALG
jgi:hypothetical protein